LAASSRERGNIARDLHDGVLQDLAGAAYALGAARRASTPHDGGDIHRMLDLSSVALERAINSLRTLVVEISPPDLTAQGLTAALGDLAVRLRSTCSIEVNLHVSLSEKVSPDAAATVYRAARECLVNVAKHARASEVDVTLTQEDGLVRLAVTDNGLGMPTTARNGPANGHMGLALLTDAVRDLGGVLTTAPGTAGGTTVELILPSEANGSR
jgi:signal transduction histidine kinase